MAANIGATVDPCKKITNLVQYLYLKEVRANTSLIGGKIFYCGEQWDKEDYDKAFPEPVLKYNIQNPDGTNIGK